MKINGKVIDCIDDMTTALETIKKYGFQSDKIQPLNTLVILTNEGIVVLKRPYNENVRDIDFTVMSNDEFIQSSEPIQGGNILLVNDFEVFKVTGPVERTCTAHPTQFEFPVSIGKTLYFRLRYGQFSLNFLDNMFVDLCGGSCPELWGNCTWEDAKMLLLKCNVFIDDDEYAFKEGSK